MGLFDRIFGRQPAVKVTQEFRPLTAYQPIFSSYSGKLYESDLVRSAIHTRATHISKLKIEFVGEKQVANRMRQPNAFQTWSQFMYKLATIYDMDCTAFIVPVFDQMNRIVELYAVEPSHAKMVEVNGRPWIAFEFSDGRFTQLPVQQVGILTKFQYKNEYFGSDNNALRATMALIDIQQQGITEGVKSAASIRFLAKLANTLRPEDLAREQKNFRELNLTASNNGGVLLFDQKYADVKQIDSKPFIVDAEQMASINKSVYNYFQVNEDVLQSKAFGDAWSAFYEGVIEPFAIQFGEVMTRMFRSCGNLNRGEIMATANRMQYLSNGEKKEIVKEMVDRGIMNRDEAREIWNLSPLPNGEGQAFIIRGEYYNATTKINEEEDGNDGNTGI